MNNCETREQVTDDEEITNADWHALTNDITRSEFIAMFGDDGLDENEIFPVAPNPDETCASE